MAVAVTVPNDEDMGDGGLKRRVPVGGSAKGIPLKLSTTPVVDPTTVPLSIVTVGLVARFSANGIARPSATRAK